MQLTRRHTYTESEKGIRSTLERILTAFIPSSPQNDWLYSVCAPERKRHQRKTPSHVIGVQSVADDINGKIKIGLHQFDSCRYRSQNQCSNSEKICRHKVSRAEVHSVHDQLVTLPNDR